MTLRTIHGRKGQSTEYYEYRMQKPSVIVQRYGKHQWFLGVVHVDRSWQTLAYYEVLADVQRLAKKLAQQYATAETYTVEDDKTIARDLVEQYAEQVPCQVIQADH